MCVYSLYMYDISFINQCNMQIKGTTALIAACFEGHDGVVKVLISNGVKVNQTDQNGNTALLASVSA